MVLRVDEIVEVKEIKDQAQKTASAEKEIPKEVKTQTLERPQVIDAKVYKLKSRFVKYSIYITLGYVEIDGKKRPYEIFINSKDLTRAPEFAVLTRLISAIFRKSENPVFILEELKSIHDPNGGYLKDGKYIHSLYAEIAYVIEQFFKDIGLIKDEKNKSLISFSLSGSPGASLTQNVDENNLKICPECNMKTLKVEAGCFSCVNTECGYSRCD